MEFYESLDGDAVPKGAPLDFNPKTPPAEEHHRARPIRRAMHHFFEGNSG